MTTTIAELPPEGVDLRAELIAWQAARMGQALVQAGGDLTEAARLLRMTRLELLRMEARIAPVVPPIDPESIPRLAGGVEFISAAAIKRYAIEGLTDRQIARRLGCNHFLVEKVLRAEVGNEVRRLDGEGLSAREIALRLRLTLARVRGHLSPDVMAPGGKP